MSLFGGDSLFGNNRPSTPALTPELLQALAEQQGGGAGVVGGLANAGLGVVGGVLDWLSHPGQAARSLMAAPAALVNDGPGAALGRVVDAGQHIGESVADLLTAGAFGKAYKGYAGEEFTTQAESPEFTDLIEAYAGKANRPTGWKGFAADVVGGAFTDPLSYLTMGGSGIGLAGKGLAGASGALTARNTLTRGLLSTTKGRAALRAQVGQGAAQQVLGALDTGSLKGLAESSLDLLDDASEAIFRARLPGPHRQGPGQFLQDDFWRNAGSAQTQYIDHATRQLLEEGLLEPAHLKWGLGKAKWEVPGSRAVLEGMPAFGRELGAPAALGEAFGAGIGLPSGVGAAAGAATRRLMGAGNRAKVDDFVDQAWSDVVTGVYDKFGDWRIPQQLRETARQFEQRAKGANVKAEEDAWRIFGGVEQPKREAIFDVLAELEKQGVQSGAPAAALRQAAVPMAAQRAGISLQEADDLLTKLWASFEGQQDDLVALGVWPTKEDRFYVPHVLHPEVQRRFAERGLDPHRPFKGWKTRDEFTRGRRNPTLDDFEDAIKARAAAANVSLNGVPSIAVRDVGDLFLLRQVSHNETMWKEGVKRHMQQHAGASARLDGQGAVDQYVRRLIEPMGGRNTAQRVLAATNRYTKPLQTIYVPAFHARNMISTWGQILLDPDMGLKDAVKVMSAQVFDMPILHTLSKPLREQGDVYKFLRAANNPADQAAVQAASAIKIGRYTGDEVLDFAKQGVVRNNFGEEVLEELGLGVRTMSGTGRHGLGKIASKVSAYVEDRARLTAFVGLLEKGVPAPEAIRRTQRMFVDYDVQGSLDRMLRDVVPYARFTVGNTPAVISGAARRPAILAPHVAAAESVQRSDPLASEEARSGFGIKVGDGQFLAGLGLPTQAAAETLNNLSSWEGARKTLAQTALPINAFLQKATNTNLYFGGEFNRPTSAPDWLPSVGPVRDTAYGGKEFTPGMSQLLYSGPLSRMTGIARTLDEGDLSKIASKVLIGAGIRTVDEERAASKVVKGWLEEAASKGEVGKINSFYERGTHPEVEELVRLWAGLRKAERERRTKD